MPDDEHGDFKFTRIAVIALFVLVVVSLIVYYTS